MSQMKLAGLLEREGRGMCGLEWKGTPVSWDSIAGWLSEEEGQPVSRQVLKNHFRHTIVKLRGKLCEDPVIRDWLLENGLGHVLEEAEENTTSWEANG